MMNTQQTSLVRKDSIEELCGHRARALALYAKVEETLAEAKAAHARACIGISNYINPPPLDDLRYSGDYQKNARLNLDRDMWRAFLKNTPLGSLMDVKERQEFEDALKEPPECTPETVFATMDRLRCESGMIFRRGLVNAFSNLSRTYKSHDGFKIGGRLILEYVVRVEKFQGSVWWVNLADNAQQRLQDVDRVFHVLDGQSAPEYQQGLCAAMRTAMNQKPLLWEVTTPYFRVKWFRNGNAHFDFLREDLVRKANLLIAEHYGDAIGAGANVATQRRSAAPPADPCVTDFFETPADLAARMVEIAEIDDGCEILEPSAGDGAICAALTPAQKSKLTCYEAHAGRAAGLRRTLPAGAAVHNENFLAVSPKARYGAILMNPPFSRRLDVAHVAHALDFLAPGGCLVAIMAGGFSTFQDTASVALRQRLEDMAATIENLPPGTFKSAGTMVNTVMVTARRQKELF